MIDTSHKDNKDAPIEKGCTKELTPFKNLFHLPCSNESDEHPKQLHYLQPSIIEEEDPNVGDDNIHESEGHRLMEYKSKGNKSSRTHRTQMGKGGGSSGDDPRASFSSSYSSTSDDEQFPKAKSMVRSNRPRPGRSHPALYQLIDQPPSRSAAKLSTYSYRGSQDTAIRMDNFIPPYKGVRRLPQPPPFVNKVTPLTPASPETSPTPPEEDYGGEDGNGDGSPDQTSVLRFAPPTPVASVRRMWERGLKWLGHRRAGTATETEDDDEDEEGHEGEDEEEEVGVEGGAVRDEEVPRFPISKESVASGHVTNALHNDEISPVRLQTQPRETRVSVDICPAPGIGREAGISTPPKNPVPHFVRRRSSMLWDALHRAQSLLMRRASFDRETGLPKHDEDAHDRVKKITPPWYASTFDLTRPGSVYKKSSALGPTCSPEKKYSSAAATNYLSPATEPLLQIKEAEAPLTWPRHLSRRLSSRHSKFKKVRKRLVNKSGSCNIIHSHIPKRKQHFLSDIFTTLLDSKWRWAVIIFTLGFLLSWTLYAIIWWLICFSHGDFEHIGDTEWRPCVHNVVSFTSVFLFSVETQHTIGFGYRYVTEECPEAVLILIVQAITGAMIQGFVTGLIFSKLSRPKKRAVTLMFSRNAVVCTRDGNLCLLVRIGDMRRSHIVDAHTRAYLFRKKVTLEGETLPLNPYNVDLGFDSPSRGDGTVGNDKIFLAWPCILVHRMDGPGSPFYDLGADDVRREKYEIVVILEGMIEATGMSMQARTSYLPSEILWGYRFQKLITFIREDGDYMVDYSRFHNTVPVNMPRCSARVLEELRRKYQRRQRDKSPLQTLLPANPDGFKLTPSAASDAEKLEHITCVLAQVTCLLEELRGSARFASSSSTPAHPVAADPFAMPSARIKASRCLPPPLILHPEADEGDDVEAEIQDRRYKRQYSPAHSLKSPF